MEIFKSILNNKEYIELVSQIEGMHFITDGKWDWEHGFGHFMRVAHYTKHVLTELGACERLIDLGMSCGLLHDIGLSFGDKRDHAVASSELFSSFVCDRVTKEELLLMKQAILDHSKGKIFPLY